MSTARIRVAAETIKPVKVKGVSRKHKKMNMIQKIAIGVGSVGVVLLALSLVHCTEAIGKLTGSHIVLAFLFAVGIDAGMVMCEVAEIVVHGTKEEKHVKPWARAYIGVAVVLSMLLNAYGGSQRAPEGLWGYASIGFGLVIPWMVLMLGRVAGKMWIGTK